MSYDLRQACTSLVVATLLLLSGCGPSEDPGTDASSVLRRGNQAEPQTLDPHRSEGTAAGNVLRDLYEGLVTEAADGSIEPGAASAWSVSDDGRTWRFALREGLTWSNGDPLTAADFVAGLRRTVDPQTASAYAPVLAPIAGAGEIIAGSAAVESLGVVAPDSQTLEIRLEQPTPYFLDLLTNPSTYPLHQPSFAEYGRDFVKPGNLIGNGAYTLASWRINDRIVLTRNARYHSANQVGFDKVEWIPEENETEEFNLFRTDELDLTASTPTALHQRLTVDYPEALQVAPILTAYFYVFDLTEPPLGDVRLREALALAVDRETLTTAVTSAGQVPAFGLVPPGIPGYTAFRYAWADWPRAAQLARARELYAAAGYSDERPLKARLLYNNAAAHEKIAVAVQAMLRDSLGAEIELVSQEFKVMLQNRSVRDAWDLMRLGWTGDYNDANTFLETFQSNHPQNTPRFADDAYDATLVAAATELDPEERQQKLNAAEDILMRQYPILPLYFNVSRHLVSPRITGFKSNVRDRIYSRHLRPANSDDTP